MSPAKKADHEITIETYGNHPPMLRACCSCGWCGSVTSPSTEVSTASAIVHVNAVETKK